MWPIDTDEPPVGDIGAASARAGLPEAVEHRGLRGHLTILLGFAAGVGKTVRMLDEGHRLKEEGKDVVVGYFEPHGRAFTRERIRDLEVVPRRAVEYRGKSLEEMD